MRRPNLSEKLSRWQMMQDNLRPLLTELPHLTADLDLLQGFLANGRELEAQKGVDTAAIRETNRMRGELDKSGSDVCTRIALALRAQYGPKSQQLLSFGIQPQRTPRRRSGGNPPGEPGEDRVPMTDAVSRVGFSSQS